MQSKLGRIEHKHVVLSENGWRPKGKICTYIISGAEVDPIFRQTHIAMQGKLLYCIEISPLKDDRSESQAFNTGIY